ncbi:MAG: lysophospholipase [Bacteroidia bacterium]|nr:lysophospholipase [Bacteroidia bacterium]
MAHETFIFSLHNSQLFGQVWSPDGTPSAVMALVHGHGEHSGRYAPMAQYLNNAGIAVIASDQFGHGQTSGKKGHTPSYAAMLDGIDELLAEAKRRFHGVPLFLYGHSMGGNIVANYVLRRGAPVQGVILSSPWLRLALKPTSAQLLMAKAGRLLAPSLTQSTKLDAKLISQIPEEVERYKADPLNHDLISPTMFFGVHEGGEYAMTHATKWKLPLFAIHGTADQITSHEATKEFCDSIAGDTTFFPVADGFHELHYDLKREESLHALKTWMLAHATH